MNMDLNLLREKVRETQTDRRYGHTLGVADTAACLAMRYEYSMEKAYIAGLLHDNAKCLEDQVLLEECRKNHLPVNKVEEKNPYLLHGKLGALYAEEKYFVFDDEILSAITYHTTGRPEMGLLEKIIFTADYIEPGRRPLPNLDHIRHVAFMDLDEAVYLILESTLNYLQSISDADNIDGQTVETYKYYKSLCGK